MCGTVFYLRLLQCMSLCVINRFNLYKFNRLIPFYSTSVLTTIRRFTNRMLEYINDRKVSRSEFGDVGNIQIHKMRRGSGTQVLLFFE